MDMSWATRNFRLTMLLTVKAIAWFHMTKSSQFTRKTEANRGEIFSSSSLSNSFTVSFDFSEKLRSSKLSPKKKFKVQTFVTCSRKAVSHHQSESRFHQSKRKLMSSRFPLASIPAAKSNVPRLSSHVLTPTHAAKQSQSLSFQLTCLLSKMSQQLQLMRFRMKLIQFQCSRSF